MFGSYIFDTLLCSFKTEFQQLKTLISDGGGQHYASKCECMYVGVRGMVDVSVSHTSGSLH